MSVSTHSLWADPAQNRTGEQLTGDESCDVCVVGAGIAGITTAYLLAKAGQSVIVLERQKEIAAGETLFTSAHLSSILDDGFARLARIRGVECAGLAYESHAAAIDQIEANACYEAIKCGFERVNGYLFPGTDDDEQTVIDEEHAARRIGIPLVHHHLAPLPRWATSPCLEFGRQAQFHPLKYVVGLAAAFRRNGGRIATNQTVEKVEGGHTCRVKTRDGRTISAKAVVVAANSPFAAGTLLHTRVAAYTTYVVAIDFPPHTIEKALYWDTDTPYHYIRVQHMVELPNDVLIVGGEDHKTGQVNDEIERWSRLEAWARARFPQLREIRARWSGEVFETLDGLALIGPTGDENVYMISGDSGMGLTHGTIAGLLLRDLILNVENPWAELYAPRRLPVRASATFLAENLNMASQATSWFTPGDISESSELQPGQGAIIRRGLKKHALYRDPDGQFHECSAVCPHLGCVVHWNDGEGTFDCPCHGSRFTGEGHLIHGPATDNLAPIDEDAAMAISGLSHVSVD